MKKLLAVLIAVTIVAGCGQNLGSVQVQGNPTLTVTVDTDKLTTFFTPYCVQFLTAQLGYVPAPNQVTSCNNQMIANFLATFQGQPSLPIAVPSPSPSPTI